MNQCSSLNIYESASNGLLLSNKQPNKQNKDFSLLNVKLYWWFDRSVKIIGKSKIKDKVRLVDMMNYGQLADGPTRQRIKSSRDIGELVVNPIQLNRS